MSSDLLMIINVKDTERRLFVSRPKENKSGALSPCDMSPDDIDYEMSQGKDNFSYTVTGLVGGDKKADLGEPLYGGDAFGAIFAVDPSSPKQEK